MFSFDALHLLQLFVKLFMPIFCSFLYWRFYHFINRKFLNSLICILITSFFGFFSKGLIITFWLLMSLLRSTFSDFNFFTSLEADCCFSISSLSSDFIFLRPNYNWSKFACKLINFLVSSLSSAPSFTSSSYFLAIASSEMGSKGTYMLGSAGAYMLAGWKYSNSSAHPSSLWGRIGLSSGPSVAILPLKSKKLKMRNKRIP